MARLRFKRFSDLAFLQSIDKPHHLAPLLAPFTDYFKRQGLNLSQLSNDDATDRKLLELFTKPDEDMPGALGAVHDRERGGCALVLSRTGAGLPRRLEPPAC